MESSILIITHSDAQEDTDIWFSDGNVILVAGSTFSGSRAFRVHKEVLSRHSSAFRGFFLTPQPVGEGANADSLTIRAAGSLRRSLPIVAYLIWCGWRLV